MMMVSYYSISTLLSLLVCFQLAVNVRLEYATYLTAEDGPLSVEVCAIMISPVVTNCPVDSTVRVRMSTSDGTAGNITLLVKRVTI